MKTSKITILSVTILTGLILGTVAFNMVSAPWSWGPWAWWSPRSYTLDNPVPDPWRAYLFGLFRPRTRDIDPSTIMLEGMYPPESEPELKFWGLMLVVPFDGLDVLDALLLKGGHLSPGKNHIILEITGLLYSGTPFQASGRICLMLPEHPPP